MSIWRQASRGLRALINRRQADQEIADEIASYLEESIAELQARTFWRLDRWGAHAKGDEVQCSFR
jgi:hypothetical protein